MRGNNFNGYAPRNETPEYRAFCRARRVIRKAAEARIKRAFGCHITGSDGVFDTRSFTTDDYVMRVRFRLGALLGEVQVRPRIDADHYVPHGELYSFFYSCDPASENDWFWGCIERYHVRLFGWPGASGEDVLTCECEHRRFLLALVAGLWEAELFAETHLRALGMNFHDLIEGRLILREMAATTPVTRP